MHSRNYFETCEICGVLGHSGKACPLYRLNEQQEALSGRHQAVRVQEGHTRLQGQDNPKSNAVTGRAGQDKQSPVLREDQGPRGRRIVHRTRYRLDC